MRKHFVRWCMLIVLAITLFSDFGGKIWRSPDRVIQWDVIDYYGYLPAAFIYHDITLKFKDHYNGEKHFVIWAQKTATGNYVFKMTMGVSVMVSPFFFVANAVAGHLGYNTGGYSLPYRFAIVVAGLFYLMLGLLFLAKVLRRFFTETVTGIIVLSLGLGTNLFWYSTFEPGMSHVYTFFLASVFIYLTILWYQKPSVFITVLLGAVTGLLTLIRPVNVLFILFFILFQVKDVETLKNRLLLFWNTKSRLLLMVIMGFLVLLPQFVYWKTVTGHWIYYSYGKEGFFFLHPQIVNVLFSFRKGWFVYTPVMIFAVIGIYFLYKKYKSFFLPVLSLLIVYLYVVSSWWCWWYGGSLGQRELIDIYPFMALPLAAFTESILRLKKPLDYIFSVLFGASVLLGTFYNVQYYYGSIHWDSMTRAAWFNSFGRIHPSAQFKNLISTPDYNDALKGLPEKTPQKISEKETLSKIIRRIKKDKNWMNLIREKAKQRNIPVDSMLLLDARYVLEHEK
ncbi:hypothetical protein LA303_04700 [Candidatus Sulfidibacterium hydrothermale]|uniref:hypothetical protein n=1 Tax=Candidatus Sulfidibacterium hydrothermale TaxID=2875962 RepID=UPI001F0AF852|nr:hypothetical protein [Candidatus Sulfidibacterium hydrothermale]UBM63274.1 hypothetical protein LA303_04700 [Candidatus Sulfidibacterium hydrothermale]